MSVETIHTEEIKAPITEAPPEDYDYLEASVALANDVRKHGDATDLVHYGIGIKAGVFGVSALFTTVELANTVGGTYFVLPTLAGAGAAYGAVQLSVDALGRRNRRATDQISKEVLFAKNTGELVQFFRTPKSEDQSTKGLALHWAGRLNPATAVQPLEDRIDKIANVVYNTGAEEVLVHKDLADKLGLSGEEFTDTEWLYQRKGVTQFGSFTKSKVVSISGKDFIELADRIVVERPFIKDSQQLKRCLQFIVEQRPRLAERIMATGFKLDGDEEDWQFAAEPLVSLLGRELQTYLDDYGVDRMPQKWEPAAGNDEGIEYSPADRKKFYAMGQFGKNTPQTAQDPILQWFGDGKFRGSQSLLDFSGQTFKELLDVMDDHASPRDKYRAALTLAYIEAVKLSKGVNLIPVEEIPHEDPAPLPYQYRIEGLGIQLKENKQIQPIRRMRTVYGRLIASGLIMLAGYSAAQKIANQHEDQFAAEPGITQVDDALAKPAHAVINKLGSMRWLHTRTVYADDISGDSAITSSNQDPDSPNQPIWFISPEGGADSQGFWLQHTSSSVDFHDGWGKWTFTGASNAPPPPELANPPFEGGDPLQGQPGFDVSRTVVKNNLTSEGYLYLPIKGDTQLVNVRVTDQQTGASSFPAVYQQTDGSVFASLGNINDSTGTTDRFQVEYWLKDGGNQDANQGIAHGHSKVFARGQDQDAWAPVKGNATADEWAQALGHQNYTIGEARNYMQTKGYSVSPLAQENFSDEVDMVDAALKSDEENCFTANAALVMSDPDELNLAEGFLNSNHGGSVDVLSVHESHVVAFDRNGGYFDATPAGSPDNQDLDNFFDENFSVEKSRHGSDEVIEKVVIGSVAGAVALVGGGFGLGVVGVHRRKQRLVNLTKDVANLPDQDARSAYNLVNHVLYAPKGQKFDPHATAMTESKQETLEHFKQFTGKNWGNRKVFQAIRKYQGRHAYDLPPETVKAAKLIIKQLNLQAQMSRLTETPTARAATK